MKGINLQAPEWFGSKAVPEALAHGTRYLYGKRWDLVGASVPGLRVPGMTDAEQSALRARYRAERISEIARLKRGDKPYAKAAMCNARKRTEERGGVWEGPQRVRKVAM